MLAPCTVWIDPGGMTGVAWYYRDSRIFGADEYPFQRSGDRIFGFCSTHKSALAIGWERFTIGPDTHKKTAEGVQDAIQMTGVARYWATAWGCRVLTPANPDERKVATRAKLEKIGWWVPGKDDAQSAAQHLLAWMLRSGELPPRERELLGIA